VNKEVIEVMDPTINLSGLTAQWLGRRRDQESNPKEEIQKDGDGEVRDIFCIDDLVAVCGGGFGLNQLISVILGHSLKMRHRGEDREE
jgi:hypothetical protein